MNPMNTALSPQGLIQPEKISHVSFDIWKTLIKASTTFRNVHLDMMHSKYNTKGLSKEQIQAYLNDMKRYCDEMANESGEDIGSYRLFGYILLKTMGTFNRELYDEYYADREKLFLEHPPQLYDNSVREVLYTLRNDGLTMSILSNTGLTTGSTLTKLLKLHEIEECFDFKLYSDEIGIAKPSRQAFQLIHTHTNKLHQREVEKVHVAHVGDNPKADVAGAARYGFQAILINTPERPFNSLIK